MLLTFLSWLYIFATTLIFGVATSKLFRIQAIETVIAVFIGCFTVTLFIGFWAVFAPINEVFYSVFFIVSALLYLKNRNDIHLKIKQLKTSFTNLQSIFKGFISILLLLILAKCASAPYILDNETYYIQTIKWLNQNGFTKGLANLHLFLGQQSGWHILQSGYNFDFIYDNLNDLSGFCLFLGNIYCIEKLNNYTSQTTKNRMDLIVGLFPVFNIFLFQFISAPSPDIAIYVFGIIIFYEFVCCLKEFNIYSFYSVFILSVFATLIKLTGFPYFILALILYFYYYIYTRKSTLLLVCFSLVTLGLFVTKNIIINGNAFYPLNSFTFLKTSWILPENISSYFAAYEKAASYGLSTEAYGNATLTSRIKSWLTYSKIDGFFNGLMLLLLVITPLLIFKLKEKKELLILYALGLSTFILLFLKVPQYRFFFPFLMLFFLIIISFILKRKKIVFVIISTSLLVLAVPIFFSINTSALTTTEAHKNTETFTVAYLIEPHANSKYSMDFETITVGNTAIYSPKFIDFFWATGNLPIPALNKVQLEYFKTNFNVIPQQFDETIGGGFYSKILIDN